MTPSVAGAVPPPYTGGLLPYANARALLEACSDGIVAVDRDGCCTYATPSAAALLGYAASDLVGRQWHDLVHHLHPDGSEFPRHECELLQAIRAGRSTELSGVTYWRADGGLLVTDCRVEPILDQGEVVGAVTTFADAFGSRASDVGGLLGQVAFVCVDQDGVVVAWSDKAQALLGWTAQEITGRSVYDTLLPPGDRNGVRGWLDEPARGSLGHRRIPYRLALRRDNGASIPVLLAGGWTTHGGSRHVHVFLRANTAAVADPAQARAEAVYQLLVVKASGDVISQHGSDDEVLYISDSVQGLLGWSPGHLIGRRLSSLIHPEDLDALRWGAKASDASDAGGFTYRLRHRSGHYLWVETSATVVRDASGAVNETLMCTRDVTARRARDHARNEETRLEALGRLAAGLAHEINTPIQYVGDNAHFLAEAFADMLNVLAAYRGMLQTDDAVSWPERLTRLRRTEAELDLDYLTKEVPSAVAQTLVGIDRVATIVRAMKTFSHPGHDEHVPADLNQALAATVTVTRHQVSTVADMVVNLGTLPPVRCNIAELNQAFLNLVINAADAVETTGRRGEIRLSTEVDGDHAVVRIEDTGSGMSDDVLAKMYDHFFTTKEVGRGTGQGLAQVRNVVQDGHGGSLSATTKVGVGTVFTLRLPIDGGPSSSP